MTNGNAIDILETGGLMDVHSEPAGDEVISHGGAMQQVKTPYTTAVAVQHPRNMEGSMKTLAKESQIAGELFYYGWGAGKNKIEGISVHLAMAAARCWGNCAVQAEPVQDAGDAWIFTSTFIDLETGYTLSRQFRQSKKSEVYGKHDAERKDDIRFQIGQSKAARNVIANALPKWFTDKARKEAQKGVSEKLQKFIDSDGIAAAIGIITKELAKSGIKEEAIAEKFSVAAVSALQVEHLVILRGDITAIQTGQDTAETLFPNAVSNRKVSPSTLLDDKPKKPAKKTTPKKPATEDKPDDDGMGAIQEQGYEEAIGQATGNPALAELLTKSDADELLTPAAKARVKKLIETRSAELTK